MRHIRTEAIIIKRKDFGEADRMLTVFTKDQGKITIKARGIRKIPSRRSPHVELLNNSLLTLYKGKYVPTLVEANTLDDFYAIKQDLNKVGFAYHICELVDGLCAENEENEHVFHLLKHVLRRMTQEDEIVEAIHEFEIELLTLLGFWNNNPQLSARLDTQHYIETILERRLKSRNIFSRLR
jgi:DNA repair protein RecO (recombination protein O)